MRWTPWSFFVEVAVMSPHDGGTHLEWGVGGSGDEGSLPNSFGWEFILFIKTHFYGGALTSHFMEEHSSPTSIFPVFMMTSSNGNMFRVTGFCAGTGHRWIPLTQTSDAKLWCFLWSNGWINNQDAGDLRRSLWRHRNVVPNSDPVIRAAVRSFGVQRVTLVQFWIGETGQMGVVVVVVVVVVVGGGGGDYHSLKLTIYFALSGSLWCQIIRKLVLSWGGNKRNIRSL